jgi:hypothetical protein
LHRVQFSPDGKSLIIHFSSNDVHYLQKASLRLSAEELQKIEAAADK